MYECPNCGGNLKFDIPSQQLACGFCDSKFDPYAIKKETDTVDGDYFETNVFSCPQCGGEMFGGDNDATAFCSYCGASNILSSRISRKKRPQFIIPFKVTKEDCKKLYSDKMRKAFFVPKEFKNADFIDGFRGIYMPYWSYRFSQKGRISLQGVTEKRKGDYIYKDYYTLSGDLDAGYAGYSNDASANFYDNISQALGPYTANQIMNFTPSFLSGFYAEIADVSPAVYQEDAEEIVTEATCDRLRRDAVFRKYGLVLPSGSKRAAALHTNCDGKDSAMFPVWFMSYRNKDRIAYATVNGQTGKIVADLPVDEKRFFGSSLLLAIPLFLILNLFLMLRPIVLLLCSAVLALAATALYSGELSKILAKESNEDDRGLQTKKAGKLITKKKKKKTVASTAITVVIVFLAMNRLELIFSLLRIAGGSLTQILIWLAVAVCMGLLCASGIKKYKNVEKLRGGLGFLFAAAAIVAGGIIAIWQPVSDLWYYGAALMILLTVVFILADLIRNYNKLAMRKLPQFEKRGGDDNA
ncbi:MAG: hypothetical protein NC094_05035 [Bacteroidales bacterium]|nr:hypothetical protein [Lachnoclostridium sp.]MCM1384266.1 hypothetical protein [Lachnoclostridium sp.]MCM1464765.1 hypothetical protein [Bacteroidales bacterium]